MRVTRSDRSGTQLREPGDCQPEQWFIRLSFCVDDPGSIQGLYEAKRGLDGEVCCGDLFRVAVDERHWHTRIGQPNLYSVVSLSEQEEVTGGLPPMVHPVHPVELAFPRGVESLTTLCSAQR